MLCGNSSETRSMQMDVTVDANIRVDRLVGAIPPPETLGKWAAVVAGCASGDFGKAGPATWWTAEGVEAVEKYVLGGGVVVLVGRIGDDLSRKNEAWRGLLGVKSFRAGAEAAVRVVERAGGGPMLWNDALTCSAAELAPDAESLVDLEFADGRRHSAATRHRVGDGAVYWLSMSYSKDDMRFSAKKKVAGEADEKGVFVLTPDGKSQAALRAFLRDVLLSVKDVDRSLPPSGWGLKPLGSPGSLVLDDTLENSPVFRPPPKRTPAFTFFGAGAKGVVVAPTTNSALNALGRELAYHLGQMVGCEVAQKRAIPKDAATPAIVIGDGATCREFGVDPASLKRGEAILRRSGRRLLVYGRGSGRAYALTYLLEALGCRYLWPGKSGKVIPKRAAIVVPELALDYVPEFKVRVMRDFTIDYRMKGPDALDAFWGIDLKAFKSTYAAALKDQPFNRGFYEWHGVNDVRDTEGSYSWGHYFGDYWKKYGREHPDWFALQPNGSREQELGNRPERPCLCVSNRGLIEQAAKDAIAAFRRSPDRASFSVCLPDGGYPSQCMCEGCRKLDPVNAAPNDFYVGTPWWRRFPYVALSDRMMAFNNAIAEIVSRECPSKKIGAYVYSMYEKPPVKVKPHPSLVLLSVAGSVGCRGKHGDAKSNVAAWSRISNELLWRPNTLFTFSVSAPQNYARQLFDELECFKVNKVVGTDFDCVNGQFANKGLIFYALAKAHRNPDHLGYDDVVADYCSAGFCKAAGVVGEYFAALEKMTDEGVAAGRGNNGFLAALDVDRLSAILDRAEKAAAGDAEVLARIAYLRRGVEAGRIEKRLGAAWDAKSKSGVLAAQNELRAFMAKSAMEEPSAVNPIWVSGTYHSPNMKKPNF